jgi:glutamate formiminotransferase
LIGETIAQQLQIPVYFYEWSAPFNRRRSLPAVRRMLKSAASNAVVQLSGELAPDLGPHTPHPTAGITVVGARGPLAAYNIDLLTDDVRLAKSIAQKIRSSRNSLPCLMGVRALGLYLPSRSRAQVSMNLTRPELTPLPAVWTFVKQQAIALGTEVAESEVIGVISSKWLGSATPADIDWTDFSNERLLETWLERW